MSTINQLINATPQLWRGRQSGHARRGLSTGYARLDRQLPGHGWPQGALTELLTPHPGMGEFRLLFPALADISQRGQWLMLIDPPWIPYPAALQGHGLLLDHVLVIRTGGGKQTLWACEQALRTGQGGAVLAWPDQPGFSQLRRLQIAACNHAKLAFLFRPENAAAESSPAALRLQLGADRHHGIRVTILKCRGNRPPEPVSIPQLFSTYAKPRPHTQPYAVFTEHPVKTSLAGSSLSATAAGSAHTRTKQH